MTNIAVLSIGSNSPDCQTQMNKCFEWIDHKFGPSKKSHAYSTPATNGKDPDYMNAVAIISSDLDFDSLKCIFKDYERSCGRTPESKLKGEIPIDIDIVMWNDSIIREKDFNQSYFTIGWQQINNCNK
jgi:2-amino-4-hydroxy-6-hydroxymethyldihydropteridine diphosphokinase